MRKLFALTIEYRQALWPALSPANFGVYAIAYKRKRQTKQG